MITLNANTKIAAIIKAHPDALDAIVSISPKFNKLRNPLLRKLMAPRTSINMASKIGGCSVTDFYDKLKPLGFTVDSSIAAKDDISDKAKPEFMNTLTAENTVDLDVRPVLDSGQDPLTLILEKVNTMKVGDVLKLINSFEPVPLIQLLNKQGYESYSEIIDANKTLTFFLKTDKVRSKGADVDKTNTNFAEMVKKFESHLKTIDVRPLEMPLPMLTILDELDKLPETDALYVYHKRIPVFLLPELQDRKFDYRVNEISDGEVHLLIFKA